VILLFFVLMSQILEDGEILSAFPFTTQPQQQTPVYIPGNSWWNLPSYISFIIPTNAHNHDVEPFEMDEYLVKGRIHHRIQKSIKNMGDFSAFLNGLLQGIFFPIISALVVFAMETTLLRRFGVTLGTANAFIWLASYFFL